jgi:hypothetical protein
MAVAFGQGLGTSSSGWRWVSLCSNQPTRLRSQLWRIASDVSLEYNVLLSPRVFGQARWEEVRRMRLPLYWAIVADAIPLTPEGVPA